MKKVRFSIWKNRGFIFIYILLSLIVTVVGLFLTPVKAELLSNIVTRLGLASLCISVFLFCYINVTRGDLDFDELIACARDGRVFSLFEATLFESFENPKKEKLYTHTASYDDEGKFTAVSFHLSKRMTDCTEFTVQKVGKDKLAIVIVREHYPNGWESMVFQIHFGGSAELLEEQFVPALKEA